VHPTIPGDVCTALYLSCYYMCKALQNIKTKIMHVQINCLRDYGYYINTCTTTGVVLPAAENVLLVNHGSYRAKTLSVTSTPMTCGMCQVMTLTYFILFVCVF